MAHRAKVGRGMTGGKRAFDLLLALALAVPLLPVALAIALLLLAVQGRPLFYRSERMSAPDRAFMLWKFRTMRPLPGDRGVSGGHKADRVTPVGHVLRRTRLDEVPQLWNILRGDLSFVGPRPPLREYVERFPSLYADVLASRPGVTGLATLLFHRTEERMLRRCRTEAEADLVYATRCIPRKARLDIAYRGLQGLRFDLFLLWRTISRLAKRARV